MPGVQRPAQDCRHRSLAVSTAWQYRWPRRRTALVWRALKRGLWEWAVALGAGCVGTERERKNRENGEKERRTEKSERGKAKMTRLCDVSLLPNPSLLINITLCYCLDGITSTAECAEHLVVRTKVLAYRLAMHGRDRVYNGSLIVVPSADQ